MLLKNSKKKNAEIEEFIKSYNNYLVDKSILPNKEDVVYFFTMGCCYAFGRILKSSFPKATIMINYCRTHCTVKYGGKIYDIRGEVEHPEFFHKAGTKDIKYMEESFGFNNYHKDSQDIFIEKTLDGFKNNVNPGLNLTITKPEDTNTENSLKSA